jgi:hypothetical protein
MLCFELPTPFRDMVICVEYTHKNIRPVLSVEELYPEEIEEFARMRYLAYGDDDDEKDREVNESETRWAFVMATTIETSTHSKPEDNYELCFDNYLAINLRDAWTSSQLTSAGPSKRPRPYPAAHTRLGLRGEWACKERSLVLKSEWDFIDETLHEFNVITVEDPSVGFWQRIEIAARRVELKALERGEDMYQSLFWEGLPPTKNIAVT